VDVVIYQVLSCKTHNLSFLLFKSTRLETIFRKVCMLGSVCGGFKMEKLRKKCREGNCTGETRRGGIVRVDKKAGGY